MRGSGANSWRRLIGCAALSLCSVVLGVAAYGEEPARELYLEVFVNGEPRNLITRFTDLGEGVLSADATELRNSGVLPGGAEQGEIRLDQITGLGWRMSEPDQTISFIVPEGLLAPHMISGTGSDPEDGSVAIDTGYGIVLNYSLDAILPIAAADERLKLGGSIEARAFAPLGVLSHSVALTNDGTSSLRRLETHWRSDLPGRMMQLQLGDIVTRGPGWSRPVRLGGAMVQRNFRLRPDLVTIPLPSLTGTAVVPSTVEVFSGAVRTYSADVPQGPFVLSDLPISTGSGVANVLIRDAAGRETRMDLPYFVSADLLRDGLADFALAVGRPRLGIGSETDDYDGGTFGVATLRYGLSDAMTIGAHAEFGPGLSMGGAGLTFRVGGLGTVSLDHARSRSDLGDGQLSEVSTDFALGSLRIAARMQRSQGEFADIAAVSARPREAEDGFAAFPRSLSHLSLSMPLDWQGGGAAGIFYSSLVARDGRESTGFGMSFSVPVLDHGTLSLNAIETRGDAPDRVVSAFFSLPLSGRRQAGSSVESRSDGVHFGAWASDRHGDPHAGWDWRARVGRDPDGHQAQAVASLSGRLARVEMAGRTMRPGGSSVGLRVDGAVVVAGGGFFLSRRVEDAFAIVDAGAPGVEIHAENRPVGRTGRSGRMLVPDLRAYEDNRLSIDPEALPLDAAMDATQRSVRPAHRAGTRVDFGVDASAAAIVGLVDAAGAPLQVGGRVLVNGADDDILVGFDGEIYARGLGADNRIEVIYPGGRRCVAGFAHQSQPGTIGALAGIPCLEEQ